MTVGGQTYSVTEEARQGAVQRLLADPATDPRTAAAAAALSGGTGAEATSVSLFPRSSRQAARPKVKAAVSSGPSAIYGTGAVPPPAGTESEEPPALVRLLADMAQHMGDGAANAMAAAIASGAAGGIHPSQLPRGVPPKAPAPDPGSGAAAMEEQGPLELSYAEGVSKRNELKHREGAFYEPGEACAKDALVP